MNNKEVKILFMGTAEFGIPTLEVLNNNYNLNAIITNYDKPSGRGLKIRQSLTCMSCLISHSAVAKAD